MKKKVILSLLTGLLASTLAFSVAGCGEEGKQDNFSDQGEQQEQQQPSEGSGSQEQQKPSEGGSQEQQKPSEENGSQNEQSHEHDWGEWMVLLEPTCSKEGMEVRLCKTDSLHHEMRTIATNPEAHTWDEGKVTKEPNCKDEGEITYTCKNNEEHTKTEKLPSDPEVHVWDEEGICSICGKTSYTTGLRYQLNPDGDSYYVSGIGSTAEKDIVLPSSYDKKPVTKIGESAFKDYKGLESIIVPNSVTEIGKNAFLNCKNLKSITIPNSVTEIGEGAFIGCDDLQRVDITDIAAWCKIQFADKDSNPLSYAHRLFINGTVVMELEIPEGVTAISDYAFYDCTGLENVIIPDSVTEIGAGAFSGCNALEGVYITDLAAWCNIEFGHLFLMGIGFF